MIPFLAWLIDSAVTAYTILVVAVALFSWLVAFQVVSPYGVLARWVARVSDMLVEPALRRIRPLLPPVGGMDLSPLALIVGLSLARWLALSLLWRIY